MAVARIVNKLLFRTRRFFFFFYPYLIIDSLLYLKDLICISTVHLYCQLCLTISSLTCSALGCLMNMWTFRPPARWAHGLLWWPRTAITNVVSCLVKRLSLFLYCLSEIKFTNTTYWVAFSQQNENYFALICITILPQFHNLHCRFANFPNDNLIFHQNVKINCDESFLCTIWWEYFWSGC